jgi:hypothetical protein
LTTAPGERRELGHRRIAQSLKRGQKKHPMR